jgi:hypothetical protein
LFGLEDLNAILGNLKRIFDSLLDGTKRSRAVSRRNCRTLGWQKPGWLLLLKFNATIIDSTIIKDWQTGFGDWAVTTPQVIKPAGVLSECRRQVIPDSDAKERTKQPRGRFQL